MSIVSKCSDCFGCNYQGKSYSGYVPDIQIGAGDYVEFTYCLGCGQIQGAFPEGEPEFNDADNTEEGSY